MHLPFQFVSATIGTALLKLKYPVYSDDLYIHLPNISMVVARECSGINFLISVIAIGLPLVYLSQKTWPRATIVIVIGCVLTVLSNGLRIAIAGYCGQNYGPELLHGPAHIFQGWSVAWVGWIGLFITNWLFGKIPYKNGEPEYPLYERWRRNETNSRSSSGNVQPFRFHFSALMLLLFSFAAYLIFFAMPKAITLNTPLQQFPTEVASWKGTQSNWLEENVFFPKLDNELSRVYRDQSGNSVYLFVGYYQQQDNDKRLISYLSNPLHTNAETTTISQGHSSFQANLSTLTVDSSIFSTLFWYQFPDKLKITSRLQAKLHVLISSVLQRQNNGAIILLATPKGPIKGSDMKSIMAMQSFAADLVPVMDDFFP
jgi:EpsI family protein